MIFKVPNDKAYVRNIWAYKNNNLTFDVLCDNKTLSCSPMTQRGRRTVMANYF